MRFINHIGKKFNKLLVIEQRIENKNGRATWKCQCDCGKGAIATSDQLTRGRKTDCGECFGNEKGRRTRKHKMNIGDVVTTNTGKKLEVIECIKKPNHEDYLCKWYKYRCLDCGYFGEMTEGNLINGQGCSCCGGNSKVVIEGINDITTTEPWMINYFQGGYEEAKNYTRSSHQKIHAVCPDCGKVRNKKIHISNIYRNRSIGCSCGDGISYPEKIIYSLLSQLGIGFITQLNKSTFTWCNCFKYDFYIPSLNCIIEAHGNQHYEEKLTSYGKSLGEIQYNDSIKEKIAKENDIRNYIVIDCRLSKLEFIRKNLINSHLNKFIDFSEINWQKSEEFAMNNLAKEICIYKNNNPELSANAISEIFKIGVSTVSVYLNRGQKIGWCSYNGKEEMQKRGSIQGKLNSKKVEVFKDGESMGVFESCNELERLSESVFNTKLHLSAIAKVCRGERQSHKGFTFKYREDGK